MTNLPLLYSDRSEDERNFIRLVCNDVLSQPIEEKPYSEEFAFIFVDGRPDANFETLEHKAMFHSCKAFSKKKYPIFCFVNNVFDLKDAATDELTIIPINPINSLEKYSEFCIKELYFKLPKNIENIITIQADGFLLRGGWEDFVINSQCDWLSSHWKHIANIDGFLDTTSLGEKKEGWYRITEGTAVGNGGFSFRKASQMRKISDFCSRLVLRESGREDNRSPMEDLFFTGFMSYFSNYKLPTLKQCDQFSCDPLTLGMWYSANKPFGFHFFKTISEFLPCNHN